MMNKVTGQKIAKNMSVEMDVLHLGEAKIRDDLDQTLDIYKLNHLIMVDEVSEALCAVSDLRKEFRHVHVALKSLLADEYET